MARRIRQTRSRRMQKVPPPLPRPPPPLPDVARSAFPISRCIPRLNDTDAPTSRPTELCQRNFAAETSISCDRCAHRRGKRTMPRRSSNFPARWKKSSGADDFRKHDFHLNPPYRPLMHTIAGKCILAIVSCLSAMPDNAPDKSNGTINIFIR